MRSPTPRSVATPFPLYCAVVLVDAIKSAPVETSTSTLFFNCSFPRQTAFSAGRSIGVSNTSVETECAHLRIFRIAGGRFPTGQWLTESQTPLRQHLGAPVRGG